MSVASFLVAAALTAVVVGFGVDDTSVMRYMLLASFCMVVRGTLGVTVVSCAVYTGLIEAAEASYTVTIVVNGPIFALELSVVASASLPPVACSVPVISVGLTVEIGVVSETVLVSGLLL